jgi:hypothetical protein
MRGLLWLVAFLIAPVAGREPALVAVDVGHYLAEPGKF